MARSSAGSRIASQAERTSWTAACSVRDEAVEAGDGDAAGFEGADQVAGEVGAATDEDEERRPR